MNYTNRCLDAFKSAVRPLYCRADTSNSDDDDENDDNSATPRPTSTDQWVLFANTRINVEKYHVSIRSHLDEKQYPGDVVLITGPMFREQKFYYTNLLLNPSMFDDDHDFPPGGVDGYESGDEDSDTGTVQESVVATNWPDGIKFDCRGCCATRTIGSAGWDGDRIRLVFSVDLPTDILSISQEMGQAGRWQFADPSTDSYHVCFGLKDYIYLLSRIYKNDKSTDFAESDKIVGRGGYQEMLAANLLEVLSFCVLPSECLHVSLARRLGNPFMTEHNNSVVIEPCRNACDYCIRAVAPLPPVHFPAPPAFPSLRKDGVKRAVLDIFLGARMVAKPTFDSVLVDALRSYPNAQFELFHSNATKPPQPKQIKQLLLMLLAAGILSYNIVFDDDDTERKAPIIIGRLSFTVDMQLCINDDAYWAAIPLK